MIHLLSILSLAPAFLDTPEDPAFHQLAGMVGGRWEGPLGKMKIIFSYRLLEGGKMIEGIGRVTKDGKTVVNIDSRFGWDPAAKQTYYLDCHGHDTVYQGHLFLKDGKLTLDFDGLFGDKGHWIAFLQFPTKDDYAADMYEEKNGKLEPTHLDLKLHRIRA